MYPPRSTPSSEKVSPEEVMVSQPTCALLHLATTPTGSLCRWVLLGQGQKKYRCQALLRTRWRSRQRDATNRPRCPGCNDPPPATDCYCLLLGWRRPSTTATVHARRSRSPPGWVRRCLVASVGVQLKVCCIQSVYSVVASAATSSLITYQEKLICVIDRCGRKSSACQSSRVNQFCSYNDRNW